MSSSPPSPPSPRASTAKDVVLRTTGLTLGHPGSSGAVLEDVGFGVAAGECVAIEGPTGSGKSTLLRALAGLDDRLRQAGTIERTRKPILMAQHVEVQLLCTTVGEELRLGLGQQGVPEREAGIRAADALEAVGLGGFAEREVDTLSAGEKQRTLLAALIALEPSVLLLDEPTSALDAASRLALADTLIGLKRRGAAIVVVDHASAELASAFDRRWVIEKRRLVERPPTVTRCAVAHPGAPTRSHVAHPGAPTRSDAEAPRSLHDPADAFRIRAGERVLVTGPNGAGKSTWLRALAHESVGLANSSPHLGGDGAASMGVAKQALAGDVALVIQEPRRALFARTAAEEIAFSLVRRRWPRPRREARVQELLARFDLGDCADRSPLRASFGQQHRLAIAAALAARPSLALLDEPFAGLDAEGRIALLRILADEQRASHTAFVLASHDRAPLDGWCDRVIELPDPSDRPRGSAEGTRHA